MFMQLLHSFLPVHYDNGRWVYNHQRNATWSTDCIYHLERFSAITALPIRLRRGPYRNLYWHWHWHLTLLDLQRPGNAVTFLATFDTPSWSLFLFLLASIFMLAALCWWAKNNNNNNFDNVYGVVIMASHCESSLGSFDECRLSAERPPTPD